MTTRAPLPSTSTGTARVEDAEIAFRVTGAGDPVLLVAGTGYCGGTWHPDFVHALAGDHAVVTFDHRGTGASSVGQRQYSTRRFAADALAVVDEVGGPAHVVGHSMGARVAQWMAVDRPTAVASLVLASSGPGGPEAVDPDQTGIPMAVVLGLVELGYAGQIAATQRRTFFTDAGADQRPDLLAWLHDAYWSGRPQLPEYLRHVQARQAHSIRAHVSQITAPTLVVVGREDTHAGATGSHYDQSVELHRLIVGSEFVALEGLKHGIFWEGMDASIPLLHNWLGRQAALGQRRGGLGAFSDSGSENVDIDSSAAED